MDENWQNFPDIDNEPFESLFDKRKGDENEMAIPNTSILLVIQKSWEQEVVDEIIAIEGRIETLASERLRLEEAWDGASDYAHYHSQWIEDRLCEIDAELNDLYRLIK